MHLSVPYRQEYKADFCYRRMLIQGGQNRTSGDCCCRWQSCGYSPSADPKPNFVSSLSAVEISLTVAIISPRYRGNFFFQEERCKAKCSEFLLPCYQKIDKRVCQMQLAA